MGYKYNDATGDFDYVPDDNRNNGLFRNDNKENDNRDTIIKAVALAIAILLNIPIYFVSGWWLTMTGICTLSFGLTLFDNKWEERKKWMNFACLITIFITIFTPLPWWLLLIELVGFCFTTNH